MKSYILIDGISHLDTDLLAEHLQKKEKLKNKAKSKRKFNLPKWSAIAACFALILVSVTFILNDLLPISGGEFGEFKISLSEVEYIGEKTNTEKLQNYLSDHEKEILSRVSQAENIGMDFLRLSDKGVEHVTLSEKTNFINYNYITYYVINNVGSIVASVDLFSVDDTFNYTITLGGPAINELNKVLRRNPNVDFVLIYIGPFTEAVVAPDNTIHFLNGKRDLIVEENIDYYSFFNKGENVVNSSILE